ncbi:MAG TPA: carnitine 3-dehydrogenase [Thermohalobaculum sp.]|nr:carnitine 3-dehydrogenase [Thermohalobaculum sp.]
MTGIARAAVIGGGVIGGGWLARLIENGVEVAVFDPDPEAARKLDAVLANADRAYARLTMAPRGAKGAWRLAGSIAEAVEGAELVVEAVPERIALKHEIYAGIEAANADAIIASSTSGYKPSDLQGPLSRPERLIVAHPFNPVYLLPLVEVVAGARTDGAVVDRAMGIYEWLGMKPLRVRKEIDAFIADRFLEAVWREGLWLVKDGIATTGEIDDAIRFGFGLRWAQMGLFETYRIAGGEAGMRHFIAQFGPCLAWPWTKLMDVPELTDELVETIASQSDAQSGRYSIRELERIRDDNLIAIMQALKGNDWGAGQTLAAYERKLFAQGAAKPAGPDLSKPIRTAERQVPPDWADYNQHLNEARYGQLFSDASDGLMRLIGADADYVAGGLSYFTAEGHIRFLDEVRALEPVYVETQVLAGAGRKMHLFHALRHGDGRLLATGEYMLIHVDLASRAACEPGPGVARKLAEIAALHARLPVPEGAGRAVGRKR